ncbi:hypothetical protein Pan216_32360 [Planctomycetes bacterium Pan216]|uniref:Uncharacterized protein n=1 Tax=Kolteria novifilia TaxID=2527975 RepID=A0A518B5W2_9BACT|nr:hypothetical protein Pan216_32360 [Planctomycetes bacterium Pan216]
MSPQTTRVATIGIFVMAILLAVESVVIGGAAYWRVSTLTALAEKDAYRALDEALTTENEDLKEEIKEGVENAAPKVAQVVSEQIKEEIPALRQQLERVIARQSERGMEQVRAYSAEQFRELVRNNKAWFKEQIETVRNLPDDTKEYVLKLEADVEKRLNIDLEKQAKQITSTQRMLNDHLERLQSDAPLEPEEMLERRMIEILRAYQVQLQSEEEVSRSSS